ncbi:MAG: D-alanyl-D-alanine carboxypeptidase [Acidimicrobiia bacterium]|nr:D-alanyl-D-alanine carboxypeptidase [Acidimicrobiia bacterium]
MRRTVVVAVVVALAAISPPAVASAPLVVRPELPRVTADAFHVVDAQTGAVLATRGATTSRPMASVTKLMTALVVRQNADLDELVVISEAAAAVGEAEIDLVPGEVWSVRELLSAIMVRSANDAAYALAEHVGGSLEGFAALMNRTAFELDLQRSHFVNPHGLDDPEHYTSASDLVALAQAAMADPVIARLAMTKVVVFRDDPSGVPRRAINTNRLLNAYPGVVGLKTGFTNRAGRVLVSVTRAGGRDIVVAVMGSEDHFADTRELIEYAMSTDRLFDRFAAGLVEGQGGGGSVGTLPLRADERTRIASMAPLDPGQSATTALADTKLGGEIDAWVRQRLPAVLGGRP